VQFYANLLLIFWPLWRPHGRTGALCQGWLSLVECALRELRGNCEEIFVVFAAVAVGGFSARWSGSSLAVECLWLHRCANGIWYFHGGMRAVSASPAVSSAMVFSAVAPLVANRGRGVLALSTAVASTFGFRALLCGHFPGVDSLVELYSRCVWRNSSMRAL